MLMNNLFIVALLSFLGITNSLAGQVTLEHADDLFWAEKYEEALLEFRELAQGNTPRAMIAKTRIGWYYLRGIVVARERDFAEAEKWFRSATNDPEAELLLSTMYAYGFLPGGNIEAFYWALKAANRGHPLAQFYIGSLFGRGDIVVRDDFQALAWYELAHENGYSLQNPNVDFRETIGKELCEADKEKLKVTLKHWRSQHSSRWLDGPPFKRKKWLTYENNG